MPRASKHVHRGDGKMLNTMGLNLLVTPKAIVLLFQALVTTLSTYREDSLYLSIKMGPTRVSKCCRNKISISWTSSGFSKKRL